MYLLPLDFIPVIPFCLAAQNPLSGPYNWPQNAAACLLTETRRRQHITPVLAALHWLPIRFRIEFKILLVTFKPLHCQVPSYIEEPLTLRTQVSAGAGKVSLLKSKWETFLFYKAYS